MNLKPSPQSETPAVRCAVYTRKSTAEGLDPHCKRQREMAEAYIASQKQAGWECLPATYADEGYAADCLERPRLQRLLADIESGKVDCVVVVTADRLCRSQAVLAQLMEFFTRHQVAFVSLKPCIRE